MVNSGENVDFLEKTKALLAGLGLNAYELAEMSFAISGYGVARPEVIFGSTDHRVTAIAFGSLLQEKSMEFTFPIPDSLGGQRGLRRVSTSLTWSSAVNPSSQKYNCSAVFTEVSGLNKIGCERIGEYQKPTRRGSIEHLVYSGEAATSFSQNSNLTITVNCRQYAMRVANPIPFALVVTMETAEQTGIQIFNQIKNRIQTQTRVQS